ncbi:TadE/TadG family type IV pilus assembly protein [Rhizobium halophytocola]|uniref:Flp pilus assembly protein TadG n=1 Tax=Rhizobium halophytocola TaxID=735519 RepID=A0ABS4DYH1_9HYPH|nr:TadE/TadG family type IV pilus assembly protein [Rhizobium halophytocola]MBP1850741.1 Flp pilus assembly protein TadG [Rhizobium halophytocola]
MNRLHTGLQRTAWALVRDCRGVSGIEFAIILPILVMLFAATLDLGQTLTVKRRLNQVATTSSDVIAQETTWTGTQLDNMLAGAAKILEPYDAGSLKIRAMLVRPDGSGSTTTVWTRNYPANSTMSVANVPIDDKVMEAQVDLITLTVTYEMSTAFTSLLASVTGVQSYSLVETSISRPRVSDTVDLTNK